MVVETVNVSYEKQNPWDHKYDRIFNKYMEVCTTMDKRVVSLLMNEDIFRMGEGRTDLLI